MFNRLLYFFLITALPIIGYAQEYIKVNGHRINRLDKQDKKQGEWIYFNPDQTVALTCIYKNDEIISPITFFDNKDTVFIRYPQRDSLILFEVFYNNQKNAGAIERGEGEKDVINFEEGTFHSVFIINIIKYYLNYNLQPIYLFGKSNFNLELASRMVEAQIFFTRNITAVLEINTSGRVTNVEYPKEMNKVSFSEREELAHIYKGMPRWQPGFLIKNAVISKKIVKHNHSTKVEVHKL